MQFAALSGKYLPIQNIQAVVSSETSLISKYVNPKNYNLHLVCHGSPKHFRRSSCEKNRFVCQDESVLLSTFVRPGYKLNVWSTRISGLHTHTHGDVVWSAYLRERSLWKYKYNEDKRDNRKTDGERQTWHGKRMDKELNM